MEEKLRFLNEKQVAQVAQNFGTPVFVYSRQEIENRCDETLAFPNAYGLTVRFAMKANPNSTILNIIRSKGVHIDASSEHEVERALRAGFKPAEIMLTSQQMTKKLGEFIPMGVLFNACSIRQLEEFGRLFPGGELSIRFNPGLGSGATKKTDVGGVTSSFGIWHELLPEVKSIVKKYNLQVSKIHTHIGSGSDPEVWKAVAVYSLEIADQFADCKTLNLGGGFKVGRMKDEYSVDLQKIGAPIKQLFVDYQARTGKKLHFEIEPGTYLMANSGALVSTVDDVVSTGARGMEFVKLDSGMDSNTRPSLYGARHPLVAVSKLGKENAPREYVVVGHCCESGDIFTQKEGGEAYPVKMAEVKTGDYVVMEGAGAYCSSMSVKNYNSYPEVAEVLVDLDGGFHLIRSRQTLDQMTQNEIAFKI